MSDGSRSRRRSKVFGFIIAETVAIVILLLAGTFVVSTHPVDSTVVMALNVVMLAAVCSIAAIPIIIFAFAPILPRDPR